MRKTKHSCAGCGEDIVGEESLFGDENAILKGKPLCETCYYDDEPIVTVFYRRENEPCQITPARNPTDGDFWAAWEPSDAWRGRYKVFSRKFTNLFSDSILAYHESETMLKKLNDLIMDGFDVVGIDYARSFARTSNVFCNDFDIWARAEEPVQLMKAVKVVEDSKGKADYDNPAYSTGIVFPRESLRVLKTAFSGVYDINSDGDVVSLLKEKGDDFIQELAKRLSESRDL